MEPPRLQRLAHRVRAPRLDVVPLHLRVLPVEDHQRHGMAAFPPHGGLLERTLLHFILEKLLEVGMLVQASRGAGNELSAAERSRLGERVGRGRVRDQRRRHQRDERGESARTRHRKWGRRSAAWTENVGSSAFAEKKTTF